LWFSKREKLDHHGGKSNKTLAICKPANLLSTVTNQIQITNFEFACWTLISVGVLLFPGDSVWVVAEWIQEQAVLVVKTAKWMTTAPIKSFRINFDDS
jgi:hypothetical protein